MVTIIGQEEKSDTIDATPTVKGTFLAFIRAGYTLPDAVAEYVDNAIEQGRINGFKYDNHRNIEVKSTTEGSDGIIEIIDNCGGCAKRDAVRFVRPGESGVDPEEGNISRFGIGGKAAGLAVSSSVEIFSRIPGENGWKIVLNRVEILNKTDWKFKIYDISKKEEIPEGATKIRLHVLDYQDFQKFPIKGKLELEERYGLQDPSNAVIICLNGVEINKADPEAEILNNIEAPHHCIPLEINQNIRVPTTEKNKPSVREVSIKAKLGLMPEGSRINKFGMNIYCNGRLLVKDNKIGIFDQTYGDEKSGHAGNQMVWLRGVVYLHGPAEAMPWNSRKNDLDVSSPTYRKLEEILKKATQEFLDNIGKAKRDLKERTGEKKLPDIREVIVEHYVEELEKNPNFENNIRSIVRKSRPFDDAKKILRSKKTEDLSDPRGEIPNPPHDRETITLAAKIESEKLDEVKKKIMRLYGKTSVTNAEVVRITLEHYKNCDKT